MGIIEIALGLAQFAPMIAGWIAGPKAQDNAQKVIDIAQRVMPGTPQDQLAEAFRLNPDKAIEFQKAAAEQHSEIMKAVLADIQNARGTMEKLAGMGSGLAWGAAIVSLLIAIVVGVTVYLVFTSTIPKGQGDLAYLIVGSVIGMANSVVSFWLGSSMSSVNKTNLMVK